MRLVGAAALALLVACAGRQLPDKRSDPPRFSAVLARGLAHEAPMLDPPRLVLFSSSEAIGVDPTNGNVKWRRPLRVFGQPASYGSLIVVPARGHRLLALDADTGITMWHERIPGEALTGIAISERFVIVTALAEPPRKQAKFSRRSVVAGFSTVDGERRWLKRTNGLAGVPAAAGAFGYVPVGDKVLALRLRTGRLVTALDPPADVEFERIERHGDTMLAAGPDAFLDLYDGGRTVYRVQSGSAPAFGQIEGMDPGLGHDDGVAFRLLPGSGAGAPRNALFLGRRALFFLRLDPLGRPVQARWLHLRHDQREYVAMHATRERVLLVRDDGSITHLDRATGRVRAEIAGKLAPIGATFVGRDPYIDDRDDTIERETVTAGLLGLVEDPDPRLLPAQRLAVDVLWRDEDPQIRVHVVDLARGLMRQDDGEESVILRKHASRLIEGVWGRGDDKSVRALLDKLEPTARSSITDASREAVMAGGPKVIPKLVSLLSNPRVDTADLDAVTRALRDLDDPRALEGVCDFVVRYHADQDIVDESLAVYYAIELIIAVALPPLPERVAAKHRRRARETLLALLADEFTVPSVRAFIEERLPYPGALEEIDESGDDEEPAPSKESGAGGGGILSARVLRAMRRTDPS
jgi:hypothetical protein